MSSSTEKPAPSPEPRHHVARLTLGAGRVRIPYLLQLKSAFRAAENCTPEGHQLILGMASKAESETEGEKSKQGWVIEF